MPTGLETDRKEPSRRHVQSKRILIIEDNRDAADTLGQILRLRGLDVRVAYTGSEGVRLASAWHPAAIVSDIGLPEMDGFEVARALRRDRATAGTRLIALSAYCAEEDRLQALEAGFDDYITKPADLNALDSLLGVAARGS
jgi:DNA-binding response OmpR family regulator